MEFIQKTAPGLIIILLVIAAVLRPQWKKKRGNKQDYGTEGMCTGLVLGVVCSVTFAGLSMDQSMLIGMLLGLIAGSFFPKEEEDGEDDSEG